jgi:hypothetical protein
MTSALDVITTNGNLNDSEEAYSLMVAYELATGICFDSIHDLDWDDLPLGIGISIIDFSQSYTYRNLPKFRRYGDIAKAFLKHRIARLQPVLDQKMNSPSPARLKNVP